MRWLALAALLTLTACATRVDVGVNQLVDSSAAVPIKLAFQSNELSPVNGGRMIALDQLRPGDFLLSASSGITSRVIRLGTLAPVSHAALYIGDGLIVEVVGSGVREQRVDGYRPRLVSPADLLPMREGDVPSFRTEQALEYVGHLEYESSY